MELKTYQANSMAEALEKVKKDLGRSAVILHTRTIKKGGVLGVGTRTVVEITASRNANVLPPAERKAIIGRSHESLRKRPKPSDRQPSDRQGDPNRLGRSAARSSATGRPITSRPATPDREPFSFDTETTGSDPIPTHFPKPQAVAEMSPSASALRGEIGEIRTMVRELLNRGAVPSAVPEELQDYYIALVQNAVAEEIARDIVVQADNRLKEWKAKLDTRLPNDPNHTKNSKQTLVRQQALAKLIPAAMLECIERMLPPADPIQLEGNAPAKFVALVGPTGVGKTTTIAKLAAHFRLREHKRVGLITIDTYRIAAVEQLKAYAEILSVPLEIVMSPAEMTAAVERMREFDLVLIDTSGRSQRDTNRLDELSEFLDAVKLVSSSRSDSQVSHSQDVNAGKSDRAGAKAMLSLETLLVLSCTSHPAQLTDVVERFSPLGVNRVVFTKLDEALGTGVVLNVASRLKLQLSYLTTGQDVPDDIEVGHRRRIAEMVLNGSPEAGPSEPVHDRTSSLVNHVA